MVTASKVAKLDLLPSELDLPVPRVFSWSDSSDNPLGCEYIIMEEAQGRALNTVWSSLDIPEKLAVVDEVLSIQKRLISTHISSMDMGACTSLVMHQKLGSLITCRYYQLEPQNIASVHSHTNISWDPC